MAEEKIIRKNVKFVYYQGYLKVDPEKYKLNYSKWNALPYIKDKILKGKSLSPNQQRILADEEIIIEQKELYEKYGRTIWDATKLFEYVKKDKINSNIDIGEMIIEIEPGTLKTDKDLITFQLTKMRDNMLPAKKKSGSHKEDIPLDDDEYIGEFTSILYDKKHSVFMIQTNMHGVSVGQVEKYLTLLRRRVIEKEKLEEFYDAFCELSVVINTCDLDNVRGSQEIKKMRIRAADAIFIPFQKNEKNYLGNIRKSFGDKSGFVIDVTISIDKETEVKTLDAELVEDVLGNYEQIESSKHDPNLLVEITRKENDDCATEIVNLLRPKICDEVSIKLKPRTSVVHADLLVQMKKTYDKSKKKIIQIVGD